MTVVHRPSTTRRATWGEPLIRPQRLWAENPLQLKG